MKLVTDRLLPPEISQRLLEEAPDLTLVSISPQRKSRFLEEVADADIVMGSFGGGSGDLFREIVRSARRARWFHTSSAGVDELFCPELIRRPEPLLTCGKGESVATLLAEHAMALLLALTRCIVSAARKTSWQRDAFEMAPTELRSMTMGIVGFGAVGQALATRARAFEMSVLGIRTRPSSPPPGVEAVWGPDRLPELLRRSDVVVLTLPHTPQTVSFFGEIQFRQMKSTALLINVGRGQVVDGKALERALVEGWIAGAGLDVMPAEPWPVESSLWHMDNVIITPHIAGNSPYRAARNLEQFVANFGRFVRGEPLTSVVDRKAGY